MGLWLVSLGLYIFRLRRRRKGGGERRKGGRGGKKKKGGGSRREKQGKVLKEGKEDKGKDKEKRVRKGRRRIKVIFLL